MRKFATVSAPQQASSILSLVMNIISACISLFLFFSSVFSDLTTSNIRVFPAANHSIAGVIQVSYLNDQNQVEYAFNASEARKTCQSLGLIIASKAQVNKALSRGLETCRYGWTDEQIAVIPRSSALANCGKNGTGLVPWRAPLVKQFDVFCFNESDALMQLKKTVADASLISSEQIHTADDSITTQSSYPSPSHHSSSMSTSETKSYEVDPARFLSGPQSPPGGKVVLITCICGLLLSAVAILAYLKLRHCHQRSEGKEQQDYPRTEEWISVKTMTETTRKVEEDQRIDVEDGPK